MRVSFDGGRINERGVAVAIFDCAFHARALLGVEPIVLKRRARSTRARTTRAFSPRSPR
jgi:hypothetical protein